MAHSCRWRFPARPGTGRKLGARNRVPALFSLLEQTVSSFEGEFLTGSNGTGPVAGQLQWVTLGFDAALQVSATLGTNLGKFLDVCGETNSSGSEDDLFQGFGSDVERRKVRTSTRPSADKVQQRKPRGRPRTISATVSENQSDSPVVLPAANKPETVPAEKEKKPEVKSGEKRRGRPPSLNSLKLQVSQEKDSTEIQKEKTEKENLKKVKRTPSATLQRATKIKKLRTVKLSPLKPRFKAAKLQISKGSPVVRKRGRPPSSERLKAAPAVLPSPQLEKTQRARKEKDVPLPVRKEGKTTVRQSPRRIKPVRIVPPSKRTDATIAKQLLQRARKGAQKKMEKEAAKLQGRKGRTQLKNIRQFIMPVVSAISSRIIKTPKRFIEDDSYVPPIKLARLESTPNSRFSTTSCGSSEKSSAVSQHSSQMSSDSSRSSSPSVDTSSDSQASEEMQALSEDPSCTQEMHSSLPIAHSPDPNGSERRSRRFMLSERGRGVGRPRKLSSQPPLQQSSSSSPPPLLSPAPPLQIAPLSDPTPWLLPPMPMGPAFLSAAAAAAALQDKRKSILREPTFRWTSLKQARSDVQYFSSAKYAKEGLIRKPIFDNFRPPPLTREDVGLAPPPGFSAAGVPAHLFPHLHSSPRYDVHKRSPLLRAPRFTPSEAHSRIYESVTMTSALGRHSRHSSLAAQSSRKRKRRVFSPIRPEPRSPSHSMRTRSGRLSSSETSSLTTPQSSVSSSLTNISVSSNTNSALTPAFSFSSSLTQSEVAADNVPRPKRQSSTHGETFSAGTKSPLFQLFTPSTQMDRRRNKVRMADRLAKENEGDRPVEKDKVREKDREKENKRESRKDREKVNRGSEIQSSSPLFPLSRMSKEKDLEDGVSPSSAKKTLGRKKSTITDAVKDGATLTLGDTSIAKTARMPKKGRGNMERTVGLEASPEVPLQEKEKTVHLPVASATSTIAVKHSTSTISSVLAQADKMQMADKRVVSLLRKAKAQLYKIEKSKSLKLAEQPKAQFQGQESDSSETSVRGPRIKHVCRRAAVALGRKRAVFPDDMPTLSALPWEEREKVLSSMGNDDKSSIAGSEDAEPPAPPIKPIKPITRHKTQLEPPVKKGRRSRRCGQCSGCQVPDDCGVCTNCLDKPKFGGRNIKKQCCKMRKCQNLQWMPSKAYLQKSAKVVKKKEKIMKMSEKKEPQSGKTQVDCVQKANHQSTVLEDDPNQEKNELTEKLNEEKSEEVRCSSPDVETKQTSSPVQKTNKQISQQSQVSDPQQHSPELPKMEACRSAPTETKRKLLTQSELGVDQNKQKKAVPRACFVPKPKEKEKSPLNKSEASTLNLLSTPVNSSSGSRLKPPADGIHRIRVDFKEDCAVENVWEMGGLSILTSVPVTPRVVCFLCTSSGHVEFVYCRVCCEPFHMFCLDECDRPLEDQLENWCCRRCKFCQVCGRQHQATKQLLECNKCRNSYHPECLGPNYPTKPSKKKKIWICTKCVRCKSCGTTTPGKGWDAQWSHDFSLCHDCAKLFAKGNFCPLCNKCYDDDDYESKMMQCGKCDRWVHAKCEGLSDEKYEILSSLPESVAYTCSRCTEHRPAEWCLALEKEVQSLLRQVLTALLNSRTTSHLLRYRQAAKPPDLNPETEESIPSRRSPEGPDPPVLTEVCTHEDLHPQDLESVKRKMDQGAYTSVLEFSDDIVKIIQAAMNADGGQPENKKANSMVKSFFVRQMERVFPWVSVKESRFWELHKVSSSGLLPNAVLPPSLDHNYAQWQDREKDSYSYHPPPMKKIIPAPQPKGPGDPDSPVPGPPPTPPSAGLDRNNEDSPEVNPPPDVEDNRQCVLCLKYGDDGMNESGRLLYIGQNEWTHVNCALWSAEVFEDDDGSLKNVHMAVIRGKQLRCEHCQKAGATVGCCLSTCSSNYHFMCARVRSCIFLDDKKVYCQRHRDLIKGEIVPENGFEVLRRIFVDFEGMSLRRKFLNGLEPENIHMMIGSMTIDCLGILNDLSDCEDKLFPIGYQCSRVYWSTTDARKRCIYTCKILECRPPASEPDINSTLEHDDNRTIAHSPASVAEVGTLEQKAVDVPVQPLPGFSTAKQSSCILAPPGLQGTNKNKFPNNLTSSRAPGSRPLPSAGNLTPVSHAVVTVGDPLLCSGLRSIGSRRHSSLSPQLSKFKSKSPGRASSSCVRTHISPASSMPVTLLDREQTLKTIESSASTQTNLMHGSSAASVHKRTVTSNGVKCDILDGSAAPQLLSPLMASKDCTASSDISSRIASSKVDKAAALSGSEPALEASIQMNSFAAETMPAQSPITLPRESSDNIGGLLPEPASVIFPSKGSLCSHLHQKGLRVSSDWQEDSLQIEKKGTIYLQTPEFNKKRLHFSGIGNTSFNDRTGASTKEKRRIVKSLLKEFSKERNSDKLSSDSDELMASSRVSLSMGKNLTGPILSENEKKCSEGKLCSTGNKVLSRSDVEQISKIQSMHSDKSTDESQSPRKRTVKVTLTPLRMDSENQSRSLLQESVSDSQCHGAARADLIILATASERLESNNASAKPSDSATSEHEDSIAYLSTVQDSDLPLTDENKTQENSTIKRRYPRRSARARSNMFYGLTPLYGVRSYGEEDIPFYSSSTGKKRGKKSAEGQVDGADDLSSSSEEDDGYYYNFSRTVVTSRQEERLGAHSFFREEENEPQRVSQLDGVDDWSEGDASTGTVASSVTHKIKRRSRKYAEYGDTGRAENTPRTLSYCKTSALKLNRYPCISRGEHQCDFSDTQPEKLCNRWLVNTNIPVIRTVFGSFTKDLQKSDIDCKVACDHKTRNVGLRKLAFEKSSEEKIPASNSCFAKAGSRHTHSAVFRTFRNHSADISAQVLNYGSPFQRLCTSTGDGRLDEGGKAGFMQAFPSYSCMGSVKCLGHTSYQRTKGHKEDILTSKTHDQTESISSVDTVDNVSTNSEDDDCYCSFTRIVVTSGVEPKFLPCRFFRQEEVCAKIAQLDGVDDEAESDTASSAKPGKVVQVNKGNKKENRLKRAELDQHEQASEKELAAKSGSDHKASDSKMENCLPVSRVKPQGQDSLDAQLGTLDVSRRAHANAPSDKNILDSFNTELLKSDSDNNNNSDDCGNILPHDIMDFVLKNTPSMQALGESPESSSSELLTLSEGLGLDSNRGKDMGLFEVFSQQLSNTEPVDTGVSSSISAEEQFELPLELPSDLSVLTTRNPTVPSQNHSNLPVISESQLTSAGDDEMLNLSPEETVEKGVSEKSTTSSEDDDDDDVDDADLLSQAVKSTNEGQVTPDHFIQGHIETEHIASPSCSQVDQGHASSQDISRSGTPNVQVPVSPSVPMQGQKYVSNSADSPGPSQVTNAAVQTTSHLTSATEKLIVVNQHMQPLYVLQTLPNGVTQKIQLTSSVSPAAPVMDATASVLGHIGTGLTLTPGLSAALPPHQTVFPSSNKGLLPISHCPQLRTFPATTPTGFQSAISSSASGLLIGVQPHQDSQHLVSELSQRSDLSSTVQAPSSSLSRKRLLSKIHLRKKKPAPSGVQSAVSPSEIVPNLTLINFSTSQHSGGTTNQSGLVDLASLPNATPHRTVPAIIKKSKSGVVYFEQTPLPPQTKTITVTTAVGSTSSAADQDVSHLSTSHLHGSTPNKSVHSVAIQTSSTQTTTDSSLSESILHQPSVTLKSPRLHDSSDVAGSIGSLYKTGSQQSASLQSNAAFSELGTSPSPNMNTLTVTSGVCVLPSASAVGMQVTHLSSDQEDSFHLQQHVAQVLEDKPAIGSAHLDHSNTSATILQLTDLPSTAGFSHQRLPASLQASSVSAASLQVVEQGHRTPTPVSAKTHVKVKRPQLTLEKGNGKKHKTFHMQPDSSGGSNLMTDVKAMTPGSVVGMSAVDVPEMDIDNQKQPQECMHSTGQVTAVPESQSVLGQSITNERTGLSETSRFDGSKDILSSPALDLSEQEQKKERFPENKPKKGLMFEISSDDGFHYSSESIEEVWKSLTDKVQEARTNARLKQLSFAGVSGLKMLGIIHDAVVFLIEQLYGAKQCQNYHFRFHKPEEADEPPLNPHGSARADVHQRKSSFDMFNFLASKHRQPPDYNPNDEEEEEVQLKSARRATSMDLPMPMRFRHLRKTSKEAVGVYRSRIHGRGLFCKRNIDAGEMVIEYSGNVIRSVLTDKREKYYDSKGIGCYMFRIDDYEVVDATMHGNAARFINHSCEPNCYSRVINIDSQKHIVIFAMRKIYRGEELTYDYKFPIEDASNKLPCNCGAKKCRKFLN
ncbi:histone-lysine N-methyltransferase 2A isoform X4 [Protopterus annectens]|uniref:histone-lysine N-methyltransferase 2A isoform X4 n=1 Tax=Protopterus annectens TaxID=7888 RepID=UPI001CFB54DF|nr:histone-lysine N-methyltransferase 2A isoform X4 [Protopterus annectens]